MENSRAETLKTECRLQALLVCCFFFSADVLEDVSVYYLPPPDSFYINLP